MPKVKNTTKLKKLMVWLDENSIEYKATEEEKGKHYRYKKSDLFIPKYVISVKIDDSQTQKWYKKHLSRNPVIIRDTDTPKFVIEKIQNTIVRVMQEQQLHWLRLMRNDKRTGK
jgi:hypothetical protein